MTTVEQPIPEQSPDAPGTYGTKITESGTVAGVTNDSAATTGKEVTVTRRGQWQRHLECKFR